jgi:hypothetical protein
MASYSVDGPGIGGTVVTSVSDLLDHKQSLLVRPTGLLRQSIWLRGFVVFQFACQVALLVDYFNPLRVYVRAAVFGSSILLLVVLPIGRGRSHPSIQAAGWVLVVLVFSLLHPNTNSFIAGVAQIALYLAMLAPLFWVTRLEINLATLRRVLLIIFIFQTLSAGLGVLQVYYPGSFEPNLSSVYAGMNRGYVEDLKITLASGQRVFRPMGLTDVPGGAASAGFYAVLLGMGFYLTSRRLEARLACLSAITLGMTCIYLSQLRVWLVFTAICMLAFCSLVAWKKGMTRLIVPASVLVAVILLSFTFAVNIGGEMVTKRMSTLIQDRPGIVYYKNRGRFLEHTVNVLLPLYPLGAGLGRWGMINNYFGDNSDPDRANIYVELQWTGWLLDGGVPLILAYVVALFITLRTAFKIASNRTIGDLSIWGAIVFAHNIGTLAVTFSYPVFIAQGGMEFWLLNAVLFAAARTVLPRLVSQKRFYE